MSYRRWINTAGFTFRGIHLRRVERPKSEDMTFSREGHLDRGRLQAATGLGPRDGPRCERGRIALRKVTPVISSRQTKTFALRVPPVDDPR